MSSNRIKNVAIVGATGNSGSYMVSSLLATGKHNVTAITRASSNATLPAGVKAAPVNYDDPSSLVAALKGQDALVITMGTMAPPDTQSKLFRAAADAGVPWVFPNEWAPDSAHPGLCKDVFIFGKLAGAQKELASIGVSNYVAVTCGFWYEWSLSIPNSYGFDFEKKEVTFFDDGATKQSTSTWPQVGRAVAALLSLPVKPEGGNEEKSLEHFKNKQVYVNSFTVSQKDMLESVLRVTGDKLEDWKISNEPSHERWAAGIEAMKGGDRSGFVRMMYTRVFYPDDSGNFEKTRGVSNEVLGLPKEDLDEATKAAIKRAKEVSSH
ncbi:NAD(P)-binding protein [Lophium mytilinum]|uniref:NAD(P)-binding protein n=1 Tax=Lophium mytilinum TaxID=390894 RepID=A0A6A6QUL9_9PEZI|nr:NAD(P)-binding protein [Lophium mytilinum]